MLSNTLYSKDSLYGFINALRIKYSEVNYLRLCNWSENIDINEEDGTDYTYTPYPINLSEIKKDTSDEVPTLTITLPITKTLYYLVKTNHSEILGNKVTFFITTKDLNDESTDNYVKFDYYIHNISIAGTGAAQAISLSLSVRFNFHSNIIPARRYARNYCSHRYKDGKNCPYDPDLLPNVPANEKYFKADGSSGASTDPTVRTLSFIYGYNDPTGQTISNFDDTWTATVTNVTVLKGNWGDYTAEGTITISILTGEWEAPPNFSIFIGTGSIQQTEFIGVVTSTEENHIDICGKTLADCRRRALAVEKEANHVATTLPYYKRWNLLPFGGYPAIPYKDPRKL